MLDVLWGVLAACALALSTALTLLLLELRDHARRASRVLDSVNQELPALLSSGRLAAEEVHQAARALRDSAERLRDTRGSALASLEALLQVGGNVSRAAAVVGGLVKGFKAVSGMFRDGGKGRGGEPVAEEGRS